MAVIMAVIFFDTFWIYTLLFLQTFKKSNEINNTKIPKLFRVFIFVRNKMYLAG